MSHESRLTFVRFSHFKEWKLKKDVADEANKSYQ